MKSFTTSGSRIFAANWTLAAVQLVATLVILGLPIGNTLKLVVFAAIWAVTFRRLSRRELLCYFGVSTLFSVMDIRAVHQGGFSFSHADVAGLPIWEYFMWGFLVLHILRTLGGPAPQSRWWLVLPLALLFALPFATLSHPSLLLISSCTVLALALFFFHETLDIYYVIYTVILGAALEYTGVWSGQWQYPGNPAGGVAIWFVPMWAGIGLFTRRLVLPLVAETQQASNVRSELMR
jgi:hypothetical protein